MGVWDLKGGGEVVRVRRGGGVIGCCSCFGLGFWRLGKRYVGEVCASVVQYGVATFFCICVSLPFSSLLLDFSLLEREGFMCFVLFCFI